MASSKDLKPLQRTAKDQGWTVEPTRGGKLKWTPPQGGMPYFPSATPSDRKAVLNLAADLRRMGLVTAK